MKLIAGRTLGDLLQEDTPRERLLGIFEQVCHAVAYAHAHGVVHRDLKPDNIMVGDYGEVLVVDWGLAKPRGAKMPGVKGQASSIDLRTSGHHSHQGQVIGTPAYMSPEQARGQVSEADPRTDVFGLGAILFHILTGEPPFTGDTTTAIRTKAARADLSPASARLNKAKVEPHLAKLTLSCLAEDPSARPEDATAVAQAIATHRASVEEDLRRAEMARVAADSRATAERRARKLTVTAAAVILLLLAGGGVGWRILEGQRQHEVDLRIAAIQGSLRELVSRTAEAEASDPPDPQRWEPARAAATQLTSLIQEELELTDDLRTAVDSQLRLVDTGFAAALADAKRREENAQILAVLDDVRVGVTDQIEGEYQLMKARTTLRTLGMDPFTEEEAVVLDWLQQRGISEDLAAGFDAWSDLHSLVPGHDQENTARLARLARDLDPDDWRRRFRDAKLQGDRTATEAIAADPALLEQSPTTIGLVADFLLHNDLEFGIEQVAPDGFQERPKGDPTQAETLLREALWVYPDDAWLNFQMAHLLAAHAPPARALEAVGYARVFSASRKDSAAGLFVLATALDFAGQKEDALRLYLRLTESVPEHLPSWYNAGTALHLLGRDQEALRFLEHYVEFKPRDPQGRLNLANVLLKLGRGDEAIESYKIAYEESRIPRYALEYIKALGNKDPAAAFEAIKQAVKDHPDDAGVNATMAGAMISNGAYSEGKDYALKAIDLDSRIPEAYFHLGRTYRFERDLVRAKDAFEKSIEVDTHPEGALYMLGVVCRQLGDPTGALETFERAREVFMKIPAAFNPMVNSINQIGYVNALGGRYDDATARFREALELRPSDPDLWANVAWNQWLAGDPGAALATVDEGLKTLPENGRLLRSRAEYLLALGRTQEAIYDIELAIPRDPVAGTFLEAGHVYEEAGRLQDALERYGQAEAKAEGDELDHAREDRERLERMTELAPRLDSLLAGEDVPADVKGLLAAARLCEVRGEPIGAARFCQLAWQMDAGYMLDEEAKRAEDAIQALLRAAAVQDDPEDASRLRATALSWLTERHERLLATVLQPNEGGLHAEKSEQILLEQRTRPELNRLLDTLSPEEAAAWKDARETTEELLQQIWSTRWEPRGQ